MLTREDFYQPGVPANPGEHYRAFVRFALDHVGASVLDLGCGVGAYGGALRKQGVLCIGCDINIGYLQLAQANGMPVAVADSILPFADRSFDSVLLLEVIEHVPDVRKLLSEAFRVARKNVLITVPNSEDIEVMKANDVTYAHMLSSDHVNFFSLESLKAVLEPYAGPVEIKRSDPIYPYWFLGRSIPFYAVRLAFRMHLLKPRFFSRLYAVASVR